MKHLEWFKIGDNIPDNSTFIKSQVLVVGKERVWVDDDPQFCGQYETKSIREERYLYEVPNAKP